MADTRINNSKYFNAFKPLKCLFTGKSAHFVALQTKLQFLVHLNATQKSSRLTMLNEIKRAMQK